MNARRDDKGANGGDEIPAEKCILRDGPKGAGVEFNVMLYKSKWRQVCGGVGGRGPLQVTIYQGGSGASIV